MIGGSWIYFAPVPMAVQINRDVQRLWGTLLWNESVGKDGWIHVTESQLRLTMWANGYNMVDLYNKPDWVKPFEERDGASLVEDMLGTNEQLIVWIHRGCRHFHRKDC